MWNICVTQYFWLLVKGLEQIAVYMFKRNVKTALLDQNILLNVTAKCFGKIMQAIVTAKQGVWKRNSAAAFIVKKIQKTFLVPLTGLWRVKGRGGVLC